MRFDLRTCVVPGLVAVLVLTAGCSSGGQQGLVLTPSMGAHRPGENVYEVATGTDLERENALALGLNLETGPLRGSLLYATGATISRRGVGGESEVGDGTVLGVAGSLVFRPLGGSVLQPYLLGGVGMKQLRYSFDDDSLDDLSDHESEAALHFGGGIALTLGRIGVMVELTDLMGFEDREFGRHDTFLMAGVRLRAF
jgi:hypothetical protein